MMSGNSSPEIKTPRSDDTPVHLSIIIPAHNEERRLPPSLRRIFDYLKTRDYSSEVLVVENGSSDRTLEVARAMVREFPGLRVLHMDQRGKGLAVQRGMLEARGRFRFLCDADLSMPIEEVEHFLPPGLPDDVDVAIGSRELEESRVERAAARARMSRAFNRLTRFLLPDIHDTQCGFKCFRGPVAQELFPLQTVGGMTFDVEILVAARQRGFKIVELPITWTLDPDSRTRPWRDGMRMLLDLVRIFIRRCRGKYDRPQ